MSAARPEDPQSHSLDAPHGSRGQFSLAPATQTTVVTTTTTTTTSFPPFIMKAPRCLKKRDPELYPMAAHPTPKPLQKLVFDIGDQSAVFEEVEDSDMNSPQSPLRPNITAMDAVESTTRAHAKSLGRRTRGGQRRPTSSSRQELEEMDGLRRQSATPLSISEDADCSSTESAALGIFRRRCSKSLRAGPRLGRLDQVPESHPPSQADQFGSDGDSDDDRVHLQDRVIGDRRNVPNFRRPHLPTQASTSSSTIDQSQGLSSRCPFSRLAQTPTGSATPPLGESGYFSMEADARRSRIAAPSAINTSSNLDASLPSPSLSPITAAANLSRLPTTNRSRPIVSAVPCLHEDRLDYDDMSASNSSHLISPRDHLDLEDTRDAVPSTKNLPTPFLTDIPGMLDSFDSMPENLKCYVLYQLLRRSAKPTLHFVADSIGPSLKCDFIRRLPLELSQHVIRYLDVQSMCHAAQVSKKWRHVVNSDEKAWKDLLVTDGFILPEGEIKRAVQEGWGWQFPSGVDQCEMNLNPRFSKHTDVQLSEEVGSTLTPVSSKTAASPKRKRSALNRSSSNKKQKRKVGRNACPVGSHLLHLDDAHGPNAFASAALVAVPNPKVGIRSLRSLHLFKSIYQRHYQMRKSWLDPNTKPKHIAFRAHERHVVTCLQFDSHKILTGSDDAIIDIYDTKTGAQLKRLSGHEGGVWALEYQGDILVSGSTDRSVRVWNIETGKCLQVFQGHTSTVRCLQIVNPVKVGTNNDGTPKMMPAEPLIITGSRDSTCRVWKLPKLESRSIFQAGPTAVDFDNPYFVRSLTGHSHSVRAIAAYGDTLVSGSYDATVRVWSISSGDTVHRLTGHSTKVYSVVLDHERSRCISGSMDNYVKVWSLETGECLYNLTGHNSLVGLLDLRDNYLVSAAADSTLKIWDPESGKIQHTLKAHTGAITCFSHDGQKVISGSDRTLKMWNTKTGECVRDLLTDLNGVWQVKFDERRCISAVNRNDWTFIEVLDFGAGRDGIRESDRGRRIVVDANGEEVGEELAEEEDDEEEAEDIVDAEAVVEVLQRLSRHGSRAIDNVSADSIDDNDE